RDLSKCILCAKCIRACQELVGEGAIDYLGRGFLSKPATVGDQPLEKSECTFCGTCVALCPTGAIMEKERVYGGTTTATVRTICPFCGCGCGICLEIKNNRLVRVRPDEDSPLNRAALCVRGSYGCDFVHSPERLASPLVKVNGNFQVVSWDEALSLVADRLNKIKDNYGSNSLAVLGSSKCTNEENYLLQRFARCVLGTNNVDNGSRLYNSAAYSGLWETVGFRGATSSLGGLEESQVILLIGASPDSSAPLVSYAIKRAVRRNHAKLLVIDPRETKLAARAHIWLKPKIGTDLALINGVAKVIIDEDLFDREYVTGKTDNFEALVKALAMHTLEHVEQITGVSSQKIRHAAQLFARMSPASIVFGNGVTQQVNGADTVAALANLALLTGNIRDGGICALERENNARGACDMGTLPDFLPGYQSLQDNQARAKFETRWKCSLPVDTGLSALEMVRDAREGRIKAMYILGENPAVSFPNLTLIRQALESLDFLVVQDIFLTETAKLADVVLPATSFAEKEGTFTSFDGTVQRLRKALEPFGESLPDWEIILRVAEKMGSPMPYSTPGEVMEEISELVPSYQGASPGELERKGRHFIKGGFPDGRCRFMPVAYKSLGVDSNSEFPFTLLAGTILYRFGTGTRSSRSSRLRKFTPAAFVEISKSDAESLKVSDGDMVKVASAVGELAVAAKITDMLPPGVVFMPVSFPESPASCLFDVVLDPRTKVPALKTCSVRLERINGRG
ncbi:MAG TPA: formate dehydrogenase subunit alpha, partial [Dehalococcoidia bacterium]|nr:formate dehydrogenase subunit alpha [Dehalococcoidia bacterium]